MIRTIKTFEREGVTVTVDTTSGERVVTYQRHGRKAAPKPKKEPRRIEAKRKGATATGQKSLYIPPVDRSNCDHCPDRTDRTASQTNCSCGEKTVTVYECELFGDCAPMARGKLTTPGVRKCADCSQYSIAPLEWPK